MMLAVNGDELRAWMDRNGYSVRRLAAVLDVHHMTVQRWRTGEHRIPRSVELALRELERRREEEP